MEHGQGKTGFVEKQLTKTDRNGQMARPVAALANWATKTENKTVRTLMENAVAIDKRAAIPKFNGQTLELLDKSLPITPNPDAPAFGRKAVLYATCFGNFNNPQIGMVNTLLFLPVSIATGV